METADIRDSIGQVLSDRYELVQELGAGGMGSVYLAYDLALNRRRVVLKFPHSEQLGDASFRLRFRDEIYSLASLDHPHIIKIHDAGEHRGIPFAVVQYVDGGDLRDRLERRLDTPPEVLSWLKSIAAALDFVHANGFCHRDVKPANIFLDRAGHAYLSDFGIATVIASADADRESTDYHNQLTAVGGFVGSANYCPPEAIRRKLSPAYDQYSLAVTVYEAISGKLPVDGETSVDLVMAKNNIPAADIRALVSKIPERSAQALMRGLSIDREDRFPTCTDFYLEFAAGIEGTQVQPIPSEPERRGWLRAGVLAVFAAAAVGALVWLSGGGLEKLLTKATDPRATSPLVLDELHQVRIGSTEIEFREAIRLCQRHEPDCDVSWFASEDPRQTVLAPYSLDFYEVSAGEFAGFVERTGYRTTAERRGYSYHRYVKVPGRTWRSPTGEVDGDSYDPNLPVVHVSWFDADAFCLEASMRLPTEDEWEHAARGDERRVFPWGDEWDGERVSWGHVDMNGIQAVRGNRAGMTPMGHEHMSGNLAEWTSTSSAGDRILKGGSWQEKNPAMLRAATRISESPDYTSSDVGIRCAKSAAD